MPRLLSPEGLGRRVVLLDNMKTLRFSWAELEGLITTDVISGRQLFTGEGRRPNTLTWCITLNGANLSKDMAQRCIIVKLARPEYSATWEEETIAFIEEHRWEIIGDALALLQTLSPPLPRYSRWGAWERAVLTRVPDPSECQKVIAERQGEVDDDRAEADIVREHFADQLRDRGHNPWTEVVWIPSAEAAAWLNTALNETIPPNRACVKLGTLGITTLRKSNREERGWTWTGKQAPPGTPACKLNPKPHPWNVGGG
jgi:hypothetical protein